MHRPDPAITLTTTGVYIDRHRQNFVPIGGRVSAHQWDIEAATLIGGTPARALLVCDDGRARSIPWEDIYPVAQVDARIPAQPDYWTGTDIGQDEIERPLSGIEELLPGLDWSQDNPELQAEYDAFREKVAARLLAVLVKHWPQIGGLIEQAKQAKQANTRAA